MPVQPLETLTPEYILLQWTRDFTQFATDLLKIQTPEAEVIPFKFNEVQNLVEQIIAHIKDEGRLVRLIVLKARRQGMSTFFLGRYYHKCSMNFNRYATIITHEPDASDFLFSITKRYNTYNEIRPQERYNNKRELNFNNKQGTGLDSSIRVATAGKEDVGSSQLVHYLHLSEVAKWPAHTTEALLTSIMQCVPREPDTEVVFESTAKGVGGEFYDRYYAARYQYFIYLDDDGKPCWKMEINQDADPANEFSSIFVPWFVFKKYRVPTPKDFKITDEEVQLKKTYNLESSQLMWRRWAIQNLCAGDLNKFKQEYPANAEEAFLSTGTGVFNAEQLQELRKNLPKPIMTYNISTYTGDFMADKELGGEFKVWEEAMSGEEYIVSADVAEGLEHGDFHCVDVIKVMTGEQVAQYHGKDDPDLFAQKFIAICRRYNTAWAVPERNNHGLIVVTKLHEARYPKVWVEKVVDPPNKTRKRYGWLTSRSSKPLIVDNLVQIMRETPNAVKSRLTIDEMLTFKRDEKGKFAAEEGRKDDAVMSIAIGMYARDHVPLRARKNEFGPQSFAEEPQSSGKGVDVSGWL